MAAKVGCGEAGYRGRFPFVKQRAWALPQVPPRHSRTILRKSLCLGRRVAGLPERLGGAVPALIRTCVAFVLVKPEESDRGRLIISNVEV